VVFGVVFFNHPPQALLNEEVLDQLVVGLAVVLVPNALLHRFILITLAVLNFTGGGFFACPSNPLGFAVLGDLLYFFGRFGLVLILL
jgi:1,4-dihydroxy-2-naphthoate octaprenyltransferase